MNTAIPTPNPTGLDQAASILMVLSVRIDDQIEPAAVAHCALAADYLMAAGALTEPINVPLRDTTAAIDAIMEAIELIASLPEKLLTTDAVLNAAAESRTALALAR